jgi:hypothetical protein
MTRNKSNKDRHFARKVKEGTIHAMQKMLKNTSSSTYDIRCLKKEKNCSLH